MKRFATLLVLGGLGIFLTPDVASAQFVRGGFGFPPGAPVIVPSPNPFFYTPRFHSSFGVRVNTLSGPLAIGYSYTSIGFRPAFGFPNGSIYPTAPVYAGYGGYAYGYGTAYGASNPYGGRYDAMSGLQYDLMQAQRDAANSGAGKYQTEQWTSAGGGVMPPPAEPLENPAQIAAILKALDAPDSPEVTSGEALNNALKVIVALEGKGAKGPSAYLSPTLLDEIHFGGTPASDTLNLVRQAGRLEFPSAFNNPALQKVREDIEKDFAAVAFAVQAGRSPESAKLAKLESTVQRAQDASAPVIKDLPFAEATAAGRFLNQLTAAIPVLKSRSAPTLVNPKWSAEGTTVAELVKHMSKHNLRFAAAPEGNEESYLAVYRNLASYHAVLTSPKK